MMNRISQSKIFGLIVLAECLQRFIYYGLMSALIMIAGRLGQSHESAYITYGSYTALSFIMTIIGGVLADQLFGFRKMIVAGLFTSLLGLFSFLLFPDHFNLSLSFIICGVGVFLPNNVNFLGSFYRADNALRSKMFSLFYMFGNIGSLLGPIGFGIALSRDIRYAYLLALVSLSLWLLIFTLKKSWFQNEEKATKPFSLLILLILMGTLIMDYLLNHKAHMTWVLDAVGLFASAAILFKSRILPSLERKHLYLLMGMIGIALIYFTFAFQIYSTLVVFIDNHLDMRYLGFKIPSSVFAAIDPFFVVVLSPFAILFWAKCEKHFQRPLVLPKFALSLFFLSAGFCTFSCLAAWHESNLLSLIILGNLFLGAGELCLMPTLIASINQYAPKGMQSTMMGYFFMALAFSGLLSGKLGLFLMRETTQPGPSNYADLYSSIAIMALTLGVVLLSGRYVHQKIFRTRTI